MLSLDVHDQEYWPPVIADEVRHPLLMDWCRQHGVDPNCTWRLEIEVLDCGILRAYQWARDKDGKHILVDGPDGPELKEKVCETILQSAPPVTFREE